MLTLGAVVMKGVQHLQVSAYADSTISRKEKDMKDLYLPTTFQYFVLQVIITLPSIVIIIILW